MGAELGVAAVLEGSVRMHRDKVRVTAQLINAADGFHLWSETFDRNLDDIFEVQTEIAKSIAKAMEFKGGQFLWEAYLESAKAYQKQNNNESF